MRKVLPWRGEKEAWVAVLLEGTPGEQGMHDSSPQPELPMRKPGKFTFLSLGPER